MGCQNEASFDKLVTSIAGSNNPQNEGIYDKGHCLLLFSFFSAMICDLVYEYLKSEHKVD